MPVSQFELLKEAERFTPLSKGMVKIGSNVKKANRTAFLCHSHKDIQLVKGLIARFSREGINLYVDWQDEEMPEITSMETALTIQNRIVSAEFFLFLATESSVKSRWCPWEIGYADAKSKRIMIIPTTSGFHTYGSEYLQIYDRIDEGTGAVHSNLVGLSLFKPGKNDGEFLMFTYA